MMNVSTRLFNAQDYEEIAKIYNACSGLPPVRAAKFAESDKARDPEEYFFRLIVEHNGTVKGFCRAIVPLENGIRDEADLDIQIDPAARRLGLGKRVFQDASEILLRDGMKTVTSSYREDSPASACFVNALGFIEYDRYWNTRLSLQEKELPYLQKLAQVRERFRMKGIEFHAISELLDHPDTLAKLHILDWKLDSDIPFSEQRAQLTFEQFKRKFENPDVVKNAWFVAIHGGEFIGMSFHYAMSDGEGLYVDLSGVLQEFRGQGIAKTLKQLGVEYAYKRGLKYLYTSNHASNVGILQMNDKLGYVREPAYISVRRTLGLRE